MEKMCSRCHQASAKAGLRFCGPCRGEVYREMNASGYLQPNIPTKHAPPKTRRKELEERQDRRRRRWEHGEVEDGLEPPEPPDYSGQDGSPFTMP